jgi:hypothetical protein
VKVYRVVDLTPDTRPMLQFQRFHHARRVVAGIKLAAQIRKGQYDFSPLTCMPPRSQAEKWALVIAI